MSIELQYGLSVHEVERRLRLGCRTRDIGARAVAFYLADMKERALFVQMGFSSVEAYAEQNLGLAPSTTREMIATSRALEELPAIDAAFAEGRLPWSVVRSLARVAVLETEVAWAQWAEGRRVREVEAHCKRFSKGDRPTEPARRTIHTPAVAVRAMLPPAELEVWNTARAKLEAELGRPLSDAEVVMEVARIVLQTQADGSVPGRRKVSDAAFQVAVHECESCRQRAIDAAQRELAQLEVEMSEAPVDVEPQVGSGVPIEPDENAVTPVPEEVRDVPTPEAMRREVLSRDGCRCVCCDSRHEVSVHHKHWRHRGGRTEPANLLTLCEECHSMVHAGQLVIRGRIGGELRFEGATGRRVRTVDHLVARATTAPRPAGAPGSP